MCSVKTAAECDAEIHEHRARKGVKLYFRQRASKACPAGCGEQRDSTEHLLVECPVYAGARHADARK